MRRLPLIALAAVVLHLAVHAPHLAEPPGGFHRWRESDTATVAAAFLRNGLDFFTPEVNLVGPNGTTRVGTELPVYTYATALAYETLGFTHVWPRLLSLLGALLLAASTAAVAARIAPGRPRLAATAGWLTLFCPLVLFYGGRIQPDVWGMALATTGAALFLGPRTPGRLLLAALCLALAGGIKPTFFFIGLPLLVALARDEGLARAARRPALWVFAALSLLPAIVWLRHARALIAAFGAPYFYLGEGWTEALRELGNRQFYQNVFLTWPFELVIGLPLIPLFLYGARRLRELPGWPLLAAWVAGALVVFALAAGHCATPHDYYYLPLVPPLVLVLAHGLTSLRKPGLVKLAACAVALAPLTSYLRVRARYADDPEFWALRESAARLPPEALVLAIDTMPGFQLYRVGRRGLQTLPDVRLRVVADAWNDGARYLVHEERNGKLSQAARAALSPAPVATAGPTAIYEIQPHVLEAALEEPLTERR
jgi:4-amino-4-deoxy-L-arabinose transferase-like glycosyltransferase